MAIDKRQVADHAGDGSAIEEAVRQTAIDYKRRVAGRYIPISPEHIHGKLIGQDFCVTRKLDGELQVLFFQDGKAIIINGSGRVRVGLPCVEEAGKLLARSGLTSAVVAAELCADESNGRKRVFDVVSALSKGGDSSLLHLVPFDLVALNESAYQAKHYRDLHGKLREIFGSGTQVHPIPMEAVASKQEVLALYEQWVVQENAEGLVVHSEFPRIFKIKPKQSIDAVVVGYTQGDGEQQGKIRDLLLALIADDNAYQVIAKTGTGFTEQQKEQFYVNLQQKHIESDYLETDSRNIAYRMVSPSLVVEVEFGDILAETRKGQIFNPVLCLNEGRYQFQSLTSGIHLLHPVFERIREDKTADLTGCPVAQITDLVYMTGTQRSPVQQNFPTSEVIFREVYQKKSKDKIMVLKFLAWKTNKEDMGRRHPAYVMHFTNFSSGRNDPIQRDVRVSSSRKQIMQITQKFIEKNVKKGWEKSET